jgi:hypothetical protein
MKTFVKTWYRFIAIRHNLSYLKCIKLKKVMTPTIKSSLFKFYASHFVNELQQFLFLVASILDFPIRNDYPHLIQTTFPLVQSGM